MSVRDAVGHMSGSLVVHSALSMLVTVVGVAGVIYMIFVEDDPALVPMVMIPLGIGWFIAARFRLLRRQGKPLFGAAQSRGGGATGPPAGA